MKLLESILTSNTVSLLKVIEVQSNILAVSRRFLLSLRSIYYLRKVIFLMNSIVCIGLTLMILMPICMKKIEILSNRRSNQNSKDEDSNNIN